MRSFHAKSAGRRAAARRGGFTLVEILTATLLALVMMAIVTQMFGQVAEAVNQNRASIEMRGQLRGVVHRLQKDLEGATARTTAPLNPDENLGYLEIIEGPIGPIYWPCDPAVTKLIHGDTLDVFNADGTPNSDYDTTLGDRDDVIMFTSRSRLEPFRGKGLYWQPAVGMTPGDYDPDKEFSYESKEAEICWFLRGTTLYRRVLLVGSTDPQFPLPPAVHPISASQSFYENWDFSVRQISASTGDPPNSNESGTYLFAPNTLGDLTKRENRYAHQPYIQITSGQAVNYPYDARIWGELRLPTLGESSSSDWRLPNASAAAGNMLPATPTLTTTGTAPARISLTNNGRPFDARSNPFPWTQTDATNGQLTITAGRPRGTEDVILTNVLKFDVKVWDPGAPTYLRTTATTSQMILPGDPGYLACVAGTASGTISVAGYGAWVDLNYMCLLGAKSGDANSPDYPISSTPANAPTPSFHGPGASGSKLQGTLPSNSGGNMPAVYDTGSTHYESNGVSEDTDALIDEGTNGFDDDGVNGIDDAGEKEAPPPYAAPLRGVQITISVYEPDTQEIREVTVVQDFIRE